MGGDTVGLALLEHLAQCAAVVEPGETGDAARDRLLADNMLGLLAPGPDAPKIVVLAHDGHVARERIGSSQSAPMGEHLASRLGRGYLSVGFLLGSGTFRSQVFDPKKGRSPDLKALPLDATAPGSVEDVFMQAMPSAGSALVPMRAIAGEGWPGASRRMRVIGASYSPGYESHYWHPVNLGRAFDAVAFVTNTTPVTTLTSPPPQ